MNARLQRIDVPLTDPARYVPLTGPEAPRRLRDAAAALDGVRLAFVDTAATEPWQASALDAMCGLLVGAGCQARRLTVVPESPESSAQLDLVAEPEEDDLLERLARELSAGHDVVVVADPLLIGCAAGGGPTRWIARLGAPGPGHENDPPGGLDAFDAVAPAAAAGCDHGVDPFSDRHADLGVQAIRELLGARGIALDAPIVLHPVQLDLWADALGSIDAWHRAAEDAPALQLVVSAELGAEDPDAWAVLAEVRDHCAGMERAVVLVERPGAGGAVVNALQRIARATVSLSVGPRTDRAVVESLWKATPSVTAAEAPVSARFGAEHGVIGAAGPEQAADALCDLLDDPAESLARARAGRERLAGEGLLVHAARETLALVGQTVGAGAAA